MAGDVVAQSGEADAGQQAISPQRLAHFVLRTSRFEELVDWYQTVLGATPAFKNELLAFLSYDEEHHRVAILNVPGLQPQPTGVVVVHHCAFTFATLADLLAKIVSTSCRERVCQTVLFSMCVGSLKKNKIQHRNIQRT